LYAWEGGKYALIHESGNLPEWLYYRAFLRKAGGDLKAFLLVLPLIKNNPGFE